MFELINKNTGQKTTCEKVTIDGWDYYVNDEQPDKFCIRYVNNCPYFMTYDKGIDDKQLNIVATNILGIGIPKVVDEVEKLVNKLDTPENLDQFYFDTGFISGYNKSQETHPFSEEDMVEFNKWYHDIFLNDAIGFNGIEAENRVAHLTGQGVTKEIIKLWKEQQPKKVYYE